MVLSAIPAYSPRRATATVLYRVLQEHLETFIECAESDGRELPGFVKKELRGFLECGVFGLGFARFECPCCPTTCWSRFRAKDAVSARHAQAVACRKLPRTSAVPSSQSRVSARSGGFDLHSAVSVPAEDRAGLERLCKYISRPPIATDRLELTSEGKVRYTFRKAWRNGRTYVELEPLEFIARLVPLIPRPRLHLIHFHGVLAPRSRLRPLIVPRKEPEEAQGF